MITDTASNVNRARELINFIDQATAQIEQRIYRIKHAEATEIAAKIDEIVEQHKVKTRFLQVPIHTHALQRASFVRIPRLPAPQVAQIAKTQGSNAVLIQGDVKVSLMNAQISSLYFPSRKLSFFEKIIEVLDVTVEAKRPSR